MVLSIIYIVDEITSAMGSALQSEVVTDFFVNGMGMEYNTGLAAFTAMGAPVYSVMILMPFYKSLADRYGRKLFLVLNTIGMGIGMGICMVAQSPIVYILGMLFVDSIGILSLCVCAPFMLFAIIVLLTMVHETKDVDLNTVTGTEWD